jgi:Holliday junction resolvasome RuvABC DNA-binding subunit
MPSATLDDILQELKRMSFLLARSTLPEGTQTSKIEALNALGFAPRETAQILGTTPLTVSVSLAKGKKKRAAKSTSKA